MPVNNAFYLRKIVRLTVAVLTAAACVLTYFFLNETAVQWLSGQVWRASISVLALLGFVWKISSDLKDIEKDEGISVIEARNASSIINIKKKRYGLFVSLYFFTAFCAVVCFVLLNVLSECSSFRFYIVYFTVILFYISFATTAWLISDWMEVWSLSSKIQMRERKRKHILKEIGKDKDD